MLKHKVAPPLPPPVESAFPAYSPLLRQLLFNRGITSAAQAGTFLNPSYEAHVRDPFLMKGMEKAAARLLSALERNERVAIWSDYDADGIPGAVVLHDFFKRIGFQNFEVYIPDRHLEGFGLNAQGIAELAERGARVLVTIDCGITDSEQVAQANSLGLDVIITDHHVPSAGGLPEALAILDPKQDGCAYPEKMLCGSGVIFKLIQALARTTFYQNKNLNGQEKWLLDMVGLATLSDMVPLLGENRALSHFGLKVLRKSPRKGLNELLSVLRLNRRELSEDDIGFSITPRINAASRLGSPRDAFRLFTTDDDAEARELACRLDRINSERKGKVASLVKEARAVVALRHIERAPRVIVAGNPNWRPALLGLVASALVENFRKPVFVWGREGDAELKGSCRSDGSVDLSRMMQEASSVFSDFGGHKEAGGFSTTLEKVHLLESELERAYEKVRSDYTPEEAILADAALSFDDVRESVWNDIQKLAPFGVGNPKPVFLFENARIRRVEQFGKDKQHLKLLFAKSDGVWVNAIKFYAKPEDFDSRLQEGASVNLLAHFEKSTFGNRTELRLRIVDIC